MPETAAFSKVEAAVGYGAKVVLAGHDYGEAYEKALALAAEQHTTFVHAFDDRDVIAGQGALGLELLEQLPDVDTVVVPVGGGGLLAGIISALRGAGCRARIVAVQAAGAASLKPSLDSGAPVHLPRVDTIADGLATRTIGVEPFGIIPAALDLAVEVTDAEIAAAVLLLLERAKTVVEGAGAAGLAALLAYPDLFKGRKIGLVLSGGNIDTRLLASVLLRGLVRDGRIVQLRLMIGDAPGQLARVATVIGKLGGNIVEVQHQRLFGVVAKATELDVTVETRGRDHMRELVAALEAEGFKVRVLEGADA
jgi:threonine dehydratase